MHIFLIFLTLSQITPMQEIYIEAHAVAQSPRLVVQLTRGCSGSSMIFYTLHELASSAHFGNRIFNLTELKETRHGMHQLPSKELLNPKVKHNPFFSDTCDVGCALNILMTKAASNGDDLVIISCQNAQHLTQSVMHILRKWNAVFFVLQRLNELDHILCNVRDCFHKSQKSVPVFRNGSASNICFDRRILPDTSKVQVRLHPSDVPKSVVKYTMSTLEYFALLRHFEFEEPPVFFYEALTMFQSRQPLSFIFSLQEWMALTQHTLREPKTPTGVESFLNNFVEKNGFREFEAMDEKIFNAAEIWNDGLQHSKPYITRYWNNYTALLLDLGYKRG